MVTQQVVDYIKSELSKSFTAEQISEKLLQSGWKQNDITAALQMAISNVPVPPPPPPVSTSGVNNSGSGDATVIPEEIKGWNWAACLWSWIWSINNHVWMGLLALVPGINWIIMLVLGMYGNEWAWRAKHWESVEQFKKTQRTWVKWWFIIALPLIFLSFIAWVSMFVLIAVNPAEQMKKANDLQTRNDSAQVVVAAERFYVSNNAFPWNTASTKPADTYYAADVTSEPWFTNLVTGAGLPQTVLSDFRKNTQPVLLYKDAGVNGTISLCYKPQSQLTATQAKQACQQQIYSQALSAYACSPGNEMICVLSDQSPPPSSSIQSTPDTLTNSLTAAPVLTTVTQTPTPTPVPSKFKSAGTVTIEKGVTATITDATDLGSTIKISITFNNSSASKQTVNEIRVVMNSMTHGTGYNENYLSFDLAGGETRKETLTYNKLPNPPFKWNYSSASFGSILSLGTYTP